MARGFGATLGVSTSDIIRGISFLTPTVHSFAGWYYKNGAGGLGNARIFDKEGASPGDAILRNANATSGIRYSRSFSTTGGLWETTDTDAFASGKWIHIVQTHDATSTGNNPVIYINGRLATVSTITAPAGTASQGTGTLSIGNRSTTGVDWDGAIDDPAWWSGVILTAAEARALYQGADPRAIRPQYLTEYLVFNEGRPYSAVKSTQPTVTGTKVRGDRLTIAPARSFSFAAALANAYNVTISVTNAPAVSLARAASLARSIAASAASTMSLATLKAKGVVISVAASTAVTQLRGVGLVRSITNAPAASLARAATLARSITASAASVMTMTRARALQATISVTHATSVTLATLKAKGVLISVTNAPAVSLSMLRAFGRSISVAGSTTVSILRPASLKRTLNFTSAVSALLSWLRPEAGIGASRILRIPAEIRKLIIKPEVRTLTIEPENRTVAVKSEKN